VILRFLLLNIGISALVSHQKSGFLVARHEILSNLTVFTSLIDFSTRTWPFPLNCSQIISAFILRALHPVKQILLLANMTSRRLDSKYISFNVRVSQVFSDKDGTLEKRHSTNIQEGYKFNARILFQKNKGVIICAVRKSIHGQPY
tara:strand:- start:159 stop:596 length:438 start_codon:yes stop_codon:yes gene_type:complete